MPIPIQQQKPSQDTCPVSDPTCSAEQPSAAPEQPTTTEPSPDQPEPQAGTEGIRTIPIPIPGGSTGKQQQYIEQQQVAPPQAGPPPQQQGPGLRNLVRFLNNSEGAMQNNDSAYLRTMYSTDSAGLVLKSAMNSSGYY